MQFTADIPGMPDFYDHRARPDPEPGLPLGFHQRRRIVVGTHAIVTRLDASFLELAMRAENEVREAPGMRLEARDLAAALGVTVQRLAYAVASYPRLQKEYTATTRREATGKGAWVRAAFYFLV